MELGSGSAKQRLSLIGNGSISSNEAAFLAVRGVGFLVPKHPENKRLRRKSALEGARVAGEFEVRRPHRLPILNHLACAFPIWNAGELALEFLVEEQRLEPKG